ncbi:MAG: hypothetical protein HQ567_25365 [Candidatus Nealsonbacteria bacterium]|nr:hypothetical protein [Candidatus Nealsonbacteria bacterium]
MRIGNQLTGIDLMAQHNLLQSYNQLNLSAVRLSTMQRINTASDDPAGLIAVENMRAELTAINAATDNAARAGGIISTADSAMAEISSLLNTVRGNTVAAASDGRSDAEVAALQMETDAALAAINRIGNSTSFGGKPLLDGSTMTFVFSPDVSDTSTVTMPHVSTSALGGASGMLSDLGSGGSSNLADGDLYTAMSILDEAGSQVVNARASLGAFQKYTVESSVRVLDSMEENISSAFSQIFDTDVAQESSQLIRAQILVDAGISTLMTAGQSRSQIGRLVGGW